ncbi:MAG TPA: DUF3052 domain-containing protein [Acidimicrobiales bacterium]|nr:DUF3052 domain-containing protein [Acidimicrobiales bacterium]
MSDEPLAISRKLGIKTGHRVVLVHPRDGFALADLPERATVEVAGSAPAAPADVVIAFFATTAELESEVTSLGAAITVDGALWLAWPRRAGGGVSDLTDNVVRSLGLASGLVDVKVAALGERWSSLRFVHRVAQREALRRR